MASSPVNQPDAAASDAKVHEAELKAHGLRAPPDDTQTTGDAQTPAHDQHSAQAALAAHATRQSAHDETVHTTAVTSTRRSRSQYTSMSGSSLLKADAPDLSLRHAAISHPLRSYASLTWRNHRHPQLGNVARSFVPSCRISCLVV